MDKFNPQELKKLYKPAHDSGGEENGKVTIIGGSELFHGAPLLSLKVASRIVDMVFFASPEKSVGHVAEGIKSKLFSFIWIPWDEAQIYVEKSDAVLIGPGFMRFRSERTPHKDRAHVCDEACRATREITEKFLKGYPQKRWVIDAGSLQVMDPEWIPEGSIVTPNKKEYQIMFGDMPPEEVAKEYKCTIIVKGPTAYVVDTERRVEVINGNPGLTKGGTGDVLAGLAVALYAKNKAFSAACAASYITKAAADELYKKVGTGYNADDLADKIPETLSSLSK